MCNEKECINRRSSIYQFLNGAGINEILNNDNFYFVADTMPLKDGGGNIKQSNFSEENFKNLEKYGNVLITNTYTGENLFFTYRIINIFMCFIYIVSIRIK